MPHFSPITTRRVLILVALAYFAAFTYPNLFGARDEHILSQKSGDEYFQYPFLLRMVTPGDTPAETRYRWVSYGHWIYGYPFYIYSAFSVLPLRWYYGDELINHTRLILVTLRQLVSVLPITLAMLLLVYLQTRFRSLPLALATFLTLAVIPGVVRQNIWWWHPDALTILAVVLTFFFLERDDLRFGRNFYLAAASCGMAASIKTIGAFFFLSIAVYLLAGLLGRRIRLGRAVLAGAGFIAVMLATVVFTNPLLLLPAQRAKIIQVHVDHSYFFTHGWQDDDPYATGLKAWLPILEGWYANRWFLVFALGALLVGCFLGRQRLLYALIAAWVAPLSLYLIFYIAVKPDHYWLPVTLPLFSCIPALVPRLGAWLHEKLPNAPRLAGALTLALGLAVAAALIWQFSDNYVTLQRLLVNATQSRWW